MSVWPANDPSSTPTSPTSPASEGKSVLCVGRRLSNGDWTGITTIEQVEREGYFVIGATEHCRPGLVQVGWPPLPITFVATVID